MRATSRQNAAGAFSRSGITIRGRAGACARRRFGGDRRCPRTFATASPGSLRNPRRRSHSALRPKHLIAPGARSDDPPDFTLDGVLLVDDVDDARWQRLVRMRFTADERVYDAALVPFLVDLARSDA
jgi:hypothetical protein